jgi:rfaE bifunctional protein kinase chain/domain
LNSADLISGFSDLNIVIVGDVMIDAYIWGEHSRMSPEAPVPVVDVKLRDMRLGGAANVALNIKGAGAEAFIVTVLGNKGRAEDFISLMQKAELNTDGIILSDKRRCTVKTRVISNEKHMMRVDEEDVHDLLLVEEDSLIHRFKTILSSRKVDAVILQDYNKGVLTPTVIKKLINTSKEHGIPTMVDPKKENFHAFTGCSLFKPNLKELVEGEGLMLAEVNEESLAEAVRALRESMPHEKTLITLSEHGVYWNSEEETGLMPVFEREIIDVSGAGDTVISIATLALAGGANLAKSAELANLSGGMVCEKVGVHPISGEALRAEAMSKDI